MSARFFHALAKPILWDLSLYKAVPCFSSPNLCHHRLRRLFSSLISENLKSLYPIWRFERVDVAERSRKCRGQP